VAGLAVFATAVVLGGGGWPSNHDALSAFERTEWFRQAFLAGDLFPTWSPFCFNGHGTPGPFFYHRLFYTLSGAVAALTGSSRDGVVVALVATLAAGGLGMERLGRALRWPGPLALTAAALLVLAPYTYSDWLVRGAMAELSAGMLVPWLFLAAHRVLCGERRGAAALGVVWALLFYAHVVIWLYASLVVALAYAGALVAPPGAAPRVERRAAARRALITAGVMLAGVGIHALAIHRLGPYFSLDQLRVYLPTQNFEPPKRYLTMPRFRWGEEWKGFSVEIGRSVLLGLAALLPLCVVARQRPGRRAVALIGGTALVCFALQLELSAPFYRYVPLVDVIQFPWRLMTFVTPAVIVLFGELAAAAMRSPARWQRAATAAVVVAVTASQVVFAVRAQRIRYPWIPAEELARAVRDLDGPWAGNEFLARGVHPVPPRVPFLAIEGCVLRSSVPSGDLSRPFHFARIELEVEAGPACTIHFSQFATPFVGVTGVPPGAVRRTAQGTIEIEVPPGARRVVLERRGVLAALLATLRR